MPPKLRELRSGVRRAGFAIDHKTGSHEIWKHPLIPGVGVVLAGHDGADAKPYQERQVREALQALRAAQERQKS